VKFTHGYGKTIKPRYALIAVMNNPSADGCLTTGASCLYYSFRKSENFTKELLQLYDSLSSLIYPPRSDGILNERD
jgi:hypothetical protein